MWNIALVVVVWVGICMPTVLRFINALKGLHVIKRIHTLQIASVKLVDYQHKKEEYVKASIAVVVVLCLAIYCMYVNNTLFRSLSYSIIFVLIIIHQIIGILWLLLVKKYGDYAYLTKESLASIDGEFTTKDCKFSVEKDLQEAGNMYVNIFKGKEERLFRFEVIEKPEEVIRIIENYDR